MSDVHDDLVSAAGKIFAHRFDGVIKVHLEDGDPIWIDGRKQPPLILKDAPPDTEPDSVWTLSCETMRRVLDGERALESAFISGRLSIRGDMSVMARLKLEDTHR
ncbi:MAG: SCP2 sterol-binding domain-containing protein [Pseudomonadota bacterium]